MRALLGMILGALITVGAAYIYDSHNAMAAASGSGGVERPLVNWDVVSQKWDIVSTRATAEWKRLAS